MPEQRTIIDDEGVERVIPEAPRKQKCSVCGKTLKPSMKITKDPEDWIWRECDTCLEPCCPDCSEDIDPPPGEYIGSVECTDCYEGRQARERQVVKEG